MLKPKEKKSIKLTKESFKKARRIFKYLKPYRVPFVIGWIFLLLSSSAGLLFPYLLGQLLGSGMPVNSVGADKKEIFNQIDLNNINSVALALFLLFLFQSIVSFFRIVIFTKVTENTMRDIRYDAFGKLIYMPMDFFNRNKVGELTSRIASDITLIQDTLRATIAEFFRQIIVIIGSIVFITIVSWKLSMIMLGIVPVMVLIAILFGRFIRVLSRKAQDSSAESNTIIDESLSGITNVKVFTNELFMMKKYRQSIEKIRKLNIQSGNWRGLFVSFIIMCLFGAIVFIIWQGLHMTIGPDATLNKGDFFSFIMFTIFMGASVGSIPDLYATIQKAIGATERLMELISEDTEKQIHSGTKKAKIEGLIQFEDVDFFYPQRQDFKVLDQLSFTAEKVQKLAIVGASGAGKPTLASLLLRFYEPTSGNYVVDGVNVEEYDLKFLRENMAFVPQDVILF